MYYSSLQPNHKTKSNSLTIRNWKLSTKLLIQKLFIKVLNRKLVSAGEQKETLQKLLFFFYFHKLELIFFRPWTWTTKVYSFIFFQDQFFSLFPTEWQIDYKSDDLMINSIITWIIIIIMHKSMILFLPLLEKSLTMLTTRKKSLVLVLPPDSAWMWMMTMSH